MVEQSFDHRAAGGSWRASILIEVKNAIEARNWEQAPEP
jgi:hypothetical protein